VNCHENQALLIDHYFGELAPAIRPEIEAHLQGCPECWREFLAIKRSVELAGADPAPPLPPERLRRSLQARLREEYGRSLSDWLTFRIPAYAVLLAMVLTALFTLGILRLRAAGEPAGVALKHAPGAGAPPAVQSPKVISEYFDSTRTGSLEIF
jgi:anti-sigma factor RsiW